MSAYLLLPSRMREGSGEGTPSPIVPCEAMSFPPLTPPASGRGM
ncbi:hypothetical protein SAMN05428984_1615 [Sphingomonas sp. OK281]|nr:hypothetical protein SAMN05428984_1615 [Sphingomonas sp. OK281]